MRFLVVGAGMMGSAAAYDLLRDRDTELVVVADIRPHVLKRLAESIGDKRLQTAEVDTLREGVLERLIDRYNVDAVINAVPHSVSVKLVEIEAGLGLRVADMAFEEAQLEQESKAVETGSTIVVGIGVAPGISDMLLARHIALLDKVDEASIYVGGIVENPESPLLHRILFNAESLWNEYVRPARIIEEGRVKTVEALSGLEILGIEGIGVLEAFFTDGYRSMLRFLEKHGISVHKGFEKTLRLPGHAEKVRLLRDLGLLDTRLLEEHGCRLRPRDILNIAAAKHLAFRWGVDRDIMVLITLVRGWNKQGTPTTYRCQLIDRYDENTGHTAMARTTAYTASIAARMLASGKIKRTGVLLPGELAYLDEVYQAIVDELGKRGVKIECQEHKADQRQS